MRKSWPDSKFDHLKLVRLLEEEFLKVIAGLVGKSVVCGDSICGAGETPSSVKENTPTTCAADCPFISNQCPSPGSLELGDQTKERNCLGSWLQKIAPSN